MSILDITLFGSPRIEREGVPVTFHRHQTLALLAYLAATDQPHGRDALAALFWPELDDAAAHAALRRGLYDLGQTIGKEGLAVERERVALRPAAGVRVDVRRFCGLASGAAGHGHAAGHLCDDCLAALTEAAELWRGDFLAGFTWRGSAEFDDWQSFTAESLRLGLAGVLEQLAGGLAARRRFDPALAYARRWLALDPLDEAGHRLLMQIHAWAGDRAAAARQYEECVRVLAAELGIEPAPETTALFQTLRRAAPAAAGVATAPLAAAPPAPAHNLPVDVTPFIGREPTLVQAAELLADPACRLLTVLGPGGIGKTRLAIQAARGQVVHFPHGVYFIDLAPLTSAEQLSSAILAGLGAPSRAAAEPDQHLLATLQDKRLLLILDNYEHLLTGADPDRRDGYGLVTKLAATAPQLKLLVTSRLRLNVPAEWLLPLEGLATPPEGSADLAELLQAADADEDAAALRLEEGVTAASLGDYSATALCLACIRRVQPGFRPSVTEARTIAHICRLLDGVPLAIELAAAWARVLPLAEIARRLEHGLELLTTGLRGVPARQRSMAATFDYSWRLLDPRERSILRQAAVFRGGFTAEAAAAVTGASLGDLAALVDASWLRLTGSGRYTLHELVRQYCAEKLGREHLAEAGETVDAVRRRHAACFHAFSAAQWLDLHHRSGVIAELVGELGNLWAAADWALVHEDLDLYWGLSLGLILAADRGGLNAALADFLETHSARLRLALQTSGEDGRHEARSLLLFRCLGLRLDPLSRTGRYAEAGACIDEMAALLGAGRDGALWAEADWIYRRQVAWHKSDLGDFAGAAPVFGGLVADARTGRVSIWPHSNHATEKWIPEVGQGQALCAVALGEYDEALRLAREYIAVAEELGSDFGRSFAVIPLVWALLLTGAYGQAEREARWLVRTVSRFGDTLLTAHALGCMGWVQYTSGRYERACTWWRRALALAQRIALAPVIVDSLVGLGYAALAEGDADTARHYFEESSRACGATPAGVLNGLARVALHRGQPAEALALLRQALHRPGCRASVTAGVLRTLAETLLQIGEPVRAAALCGCLLSWRGTPYDTRQETEKLLKELEASLPPEQLAAALERGRLLGPEEAVAQALGAGSTAGATPSLA